MTEFTTYPDWADGSGWREMAQSTDPNDELFGHVVTGVTLDDVDDAAIDAVLVGEPYDDAIIGRSGAREGPTEIRRSLARTKTHHADCGPVESIGDLGDVRSLVDAGTPGTESSVSEVQSTLQETTARVHDADVLPVFLGGDNSLTYPNAAPLLDHGSVGIVNLDAHLDVREVRDEPTSGTPYRQLFEAGLDRYACLGARHFETSTAYHEFVREREGEIVTAEEIEDDTVAATMHALDAMEDVDRLYVSVDCDVLDASAAPGVSAPTPGGITTRELFRCLRLLASDDRFAGFEIVECAPPLDRNGLTINAAARAVAHVLAGYLEARR